MGTDFTLKSLRGFIISIDIIRLGLYGIFYGVLLHYIATTAIFIVCHLHLSQLVRRFCEASFCDYIGAVNISYFTTNDECSII